MQLLLTEKKLCYAGMTTKRQVSNIVRFNVYILETFSGDHGCRDETIASSS